MQDVMIKNITIDFILNELLKNYSGLKTIDAWGETSLFYNLNDSLKRGIYFCTLKNKDGENIIKKHSIFQNTNLSSQS